MDPTRRRAFLRLAVRMGILTPEQIDSALLDQPTRAPLEWVLLERGLLTPELAQVIRDAMDQGFAPGKIATV